MMNQQKHYLNDTVARNPKRKKPKEWVRSKQFVNHHIQNRCRGGLSEPSNLIRLERERENAWHFLFGNLDFIEVAELLLKLNRLKKRK